MAGKSSKWFDRKRNTTITDGLQGASTVDFLTLLDHERKRQSIEAEEEELMPRSEGFIPADRGHTGKQGMFESWDEYLDCIDREYTD